MPLPVKLDDVVDAMDFQSEERTAYLNRNTGEIISKSLDDEWGEEDLDDLDEGELEESDQGEMPLSREAIDSKDYIALPSKFDIHEWSIMERFTGTVDDAHSQERLSRAIRGRGAFRCFRDTLDDLGIVQDWYTYRDEALAEIARDWLRENQIPFIDDMPKSPSQP